IVLRIGADGEKRFAKNVLGRSRKRLCQGTGTLSRKWSMRFVRVARDRLDYLGPSPLPQESLTMPPPTPFPVRQALVHAHQHGADIATLAQRFDLSPRTTRRLLCQALADGQARPPAYCRGPRPSPSPPE